MQIAAIQEVTGGRFWSIVTSRRGHGYYYDWAIKPTEAEVIAQWKNNRRSWKGVVENHA